MGKKHKIVAVEDVHTYYGESYVIQGLSMYVEEHEPVSILGRNGVGKTTTLRAIMGLTPPRLGSITIDGEDTTGWAPHQISRLGVAYVPSERHIFPGLSVEENLKLAARPGTGGNPWTLERVYDQFPVLSNRLKQDGATLSGGEQQMLAIGRALISNPKIIILDEPSQGLSPLLVQMVTEMIVNYCVNSKISILMVEQNYRIALKVAHRHYLMGNKGKIGRIATTKELIDNPQIIHEHLTV